MDRSLNSVEDSGDPKLLQPELPSDWKRDTVKQRYGRVQRKVRQVATAAVALGAFVVALAASEPAAVVYNKAPSWMQAIVFTFIAAAGLCVACAYILYDQEAVFLNRVIEYQNHADLRPGNRWPRGADWFWRAAVILIGLTVATFLVAVWQAAA